jgi:hypothetical protein
MIMKKLIMLFAIISITVSIMTVPVSAISRNAAGNYAVTYYSNYNTPTYKTYTANDCANFVSQALYAAGYSMNSTWKHYHTVVLGIHVYEVSTGFVNVPAQRNYLLNSDRADDYGTWDKVAGNGYPDPANYTSVGLQIGDIVYYDWDSNGTYDHTAITSYIFAQPGYTADYVSAHTSNRINAIWHLSTYIPADELAFCKWNVLQLNT